MKAGRKNFYNNIKKYNSKQGLSNDTSSLEIRWRCPKICAKMKKDAVNSRRTSTYLQCKFILFTSIGTSNVENELGKLWEQSLQQFPRNPMLKKRDFWRTIAWGGKSWIKIYLLKSKLNSHRLQLCWKFLRLVDGNIAFKQQTFKNIHSCSWFPRHRSRVPQSWNKISIAATP